MFRVYLLKAALGKSLRPLCLTFRNYTIGVRDYPLHVVVVRIKWLNSCKVLSSRPSGSTEDMYAITTTEPTSFVLSVEAEFCVFKAPELFSACVCCLVVSDSLRHHELYSPWNSPGKNTGVFFTSPGYLPNPGTEPRSPALQADSLSGEPPGSWNLWLNCLHPSGPSSEAHLLQESLLWS